MANRIEQLTPNLKVTGEIAKFYKDKKTNELRLSKLNPIEEVETDFEHCREELSSSLDYMFDEYCENRKAPNNPYTLVPVASIIDRKTNKPIPLKHSIYINNCSVSGAEFYHKRHNVRLLGDLLDYVVGIIGVCLSHGEDEIARRKGKVGLAGDVHYHAGINPMYPNDEYTDRATSYYDSNIEYRTISSFYLVSRITTSLILGLVRNCNDILRHESIEYLNEHLFNKISKREIQSIINTVDSKKAREVYYTILVPFFEGYSGEGHILLSNKLRRHALSKLIDEGYQSVFNPHRMREHYEHFDSHYGFISFCDYINDANTKKGYNYYKEI